MDLKSIANKIVGFVKAHPVQSVVAMVVGFYVVGHAVRYWMLSRLKGAKINTSKFGSIQIDPRLLWGELKELKGLMDANKVKWF